MALISSAVGAIGGLFAGDLGGAAIGALGSAASGLIGSDASQSAADTQSAASGRLAAQQNGMYQQNQQNLQPYMQGGNVALSSLGGKLANGSLGGQFTQQDYLNNKDPGYDFQLNQGNNALLNSQAAGDGVLSGSALKGMINYNQGMASTGYQNAYQRWLGSQQNTFGQLSGVASMGENAAAGAGTTGASYANSLGTTITGGANAQASGMIGSATALSNGINNGSGYMYLNSLANNAARNGQYTGNGFSSDQNPVNQSGLDSLINKFQNQ